MTLPLAGRRILVTRAAHQAGKLSEGLRALGAEPVEVAVLEIGPPESLDGLDRALGSIASYDWMMFTSTNTVKAVVARAAHIGARLDSFAGKIAAVGEATAAALGEAGLHVDYVPERYVAESLVEQFPEDANGKRILLARATIARDVIPEAFRKAGATVDVADAYQNVLPADAPQMLRRALERRLDAATFTSSSTVTHLAEAAALAGVPFPLPIPAISIGPVTSGTLRALGWEPGAEADRSDIPGLIAAVQSWLRSAG